MQRFSYVLSKNCIDAQKLFRANSEENVGICVFFLFSAISLFRATLLFRAIIRYFEIFRYFELFRYFVNEGGRKREGDGYLKNCYQKRGEVGGRGCSSITDTTGSGWVYSRTAIRGRAGGVFTSRTATRSSSSAHSILKRLSTTKALLRLSHLDKEKMMRRI